jgi:UDP:flavonoid glycosyltransferase YjiC (YdhE family)
MIPQGADQFINTERAVAAGAAAAVLPGDVTEETLRAAVASVLSQPGYRRAASEVRQEITALPSAGEVAPRLIDELRTRSRRPGSRAG